MMRLGPYLIDDPTFTMHKVLHDRMAKPMEKKETLSDAAQEGQIDRSYDWVVQARRLRNDIDDALRNMGNNGVQTGFDMKEGWRLADARVSVR